MKELKAANISHGKHHAKITKMAAHPDEKQDRKLVDKMVKKDALTGRSCGGSAKRASGGATKDGGKKPAKTQVNIVVAPKGQGQAGPAPAPMSGPVAAVPSRPPVPAAIPAGPSGPAPAGGLAALRPGAKNGGKLPQKRAVGGKVTGYDAGAGSGKGRLEKERKAERKA